MNKNNFFINNFTRCLSCKYIFLKLFNLIKKIVLESKVIKPSQGHDLEHEFDGFTQFHQDNKNVSF